MTRTRVLLADDHNIIIEGLKKLLAPEFELVGEVGDGHALLDAAKDLHPDVIVADISMPILNGIEAVRQIKDVSPHVKVIILTMHTDVSYAVEALQVGASGYVLKHSAPAELIKAINESMKGNIYVSPVITGEVLDAYRKGFHKRNDALTKLSARQREVLQLLAEGKVAKEVAAYLNISKRTVEFHKYKMMDLLGIKTSAELVQYAVRHRIVSE